MIDAAGLDFGQPANVITDAVMSLGDFNVPSARISPALF
jgi:hypothetical protein